MPDTLGGLSAWSAALNRVIDRGKSRRYFSADMVDIPACNWEDSYLINFGIRHREHIRRSYAAVSAVAFLCCFYCGCSLLSSFDSQKASIAADEVWPVIYVFFRRLFYSALSMLTLSLNLGYETPASFRVGHTPKDPFSIEHPLLVDSTVEKRLIQIAEIFPLVSLQLSYLLQEGCTLWLRMIFESEIIGCTCKDGGSMKFVMTLGEVVELLLLILGATQISCLIQNVHRNLSQFEAFRGELLRALTEIPGSDFEIQTMFVYRCIGFVADVSRRSQLRFGKRATSKKLLDFRMRGFPLMGHWPSRKKFVPCPGQGTSFVLFRIL